jgi:molybdate transport system regulatory protein
MSALALCKATAVTVGASLESRDGLNFLSGKIERSASAQEGAEVSVQLMPGLHVIGFSAEGQTLKAGQHVMAAVDESAVVIAIPG